MTQLTLSIPQTGLPNLTEDPKVANDLIQIQNVVNGNLDTGNFTSSLQSLIISDAASQLVTLRVINQTSASLVPGWQSIQYNFTAFPTSCLMAVGVLKPVTNGSNLSQWNFGGFSNGHILFNLNPSGTDTFQVFGLAWGY